MKAAQMRLLTIAYCETFQLGEQSDQRCSCCHRLSSGCVSLRPTGSLDRTASKDAVATTLVQHDAPLAATVGLCEFHGLEFFGSNDRTNDHDHGKSIDTWKGLNGGFGFRAISSVFSTGCDRRVDWRLIVAPALLGLTGILSRHRPRAHYGLWLLCRLYHWF